MFETSYRLQLVHPEITYPNTKWAWYVFIKYITRKLIIELSIETKVKSGRFIIFKFEDITKKQVFGPHHRSANTNNIYEGGSWNVNVVELAPKSWIKGMKVSESEQSWIRIYFRNKNSYSEFSWNHQKCST